MATNITTTGILSTLTGFALFIAQSAIQPKKFAVYIQQNDRQVEVLTGLKYLDAQVSDNVQLFDHPLENGTIITDHEIFNPKEITVTANISDNDNTTLNELLKYYKDGVEFIVKAKNELFSKVIISAKPYEIKPTSYDETTYSITFRGVQRATTQYVKIQKNQMKSSTVKNKKNASTVKTGQKQATATPKRSSILNNITKGFFK